MSDEPHTNPADDAVEPVDAPDLPTEEEQLDPLVEMTEDRDQWKSKALRAIADYDNLQKRTQRDAVIERERVKARVLDNFLRVYEFMTYARKDAEAGSEHLPQGVLMVAKEFDRLLEEEGVQIFGAVGDAFDHARYESVAEEAVEGVEPGKVSKVIQPGYLLGERVLRYAKVAVQPSS